MSGIPAGMVTAEAAVVWAGAWMFGAVPEVSTVEWRMQEPTTVALPDPARLADLLSRPRVRPTRWHQPPLPLGGGERPDRGGGRRG